MKKLIFGLSLLLSGMTGFVGWSIAATQTVLIGSKRSVFGYFNDIEWIILILFASMAILGFVISLKEISEN